MSRWIGIDLGGTNLKLGIVDEDGKILHQTDLPTRGKGIPEETIGQIVQAARQLVVEAGISWQMIEGIGLGIPGFLDIEKGVVKSLINLFWKNVPIRERLEEEWGKPVLIENDANVAALGEAWSGAGKGVRDLVCITLGTGVGGGIIVNGKLVRGATNSAGEIGHIVVDPNGSLCNCGKRGCLETISSASGIIRMASEAIVKYREGTLLFSLKEVSPKTVFQAVRQGDKAAQEIMDRVIDALAEVLSTLSVVINPAKYVIGGGVALAGDLLLRPLVEVWKEKADSHAIEGVQVVPALLGSDSGIIGAAGLFLKETR